MRRCFFFTAWLPSLTSLVMYSYADMEMWVLRADFVAPDATGPTWMRRNARVAVAGGLV